MECVAARTPRGQRTSRDLHRGAHQKVSMPRALGIGLLQGRDVCFSRRKVCLAVLHVTRCVGQSTSRVSERYLPRRVFDTSRGVFGTSPGVSNRSRGVSETPRSLSYPYNCESATSAPWRLPPPRELRPVLSDSSSVDILGFPKLTCCHQQPDVNYIQVLEKANFP